MRNILWLVFLLYGSCCFGNKLTSDMQVVEIPDSTVMTSYFYETNAGDDMELLNENLHNEGIANVPELKLLSDQSSVESYNYKESKYWKRYKRLRTAGWTCLGVGAGFCVGGYALLFAAILNPHHDFSNLAAVSGYIMFFSSPVLVAASIPLLACAYYNRNKAKHLNLEVGISQFSSDNLISQKLSTSAISLSLNF